MSFEDEIRAYKELARQINELEEKKKELSLLILQQMTEKTLTISGYTVRRYDRLSIKTSLDEARGFGATKMEEIVDKDKLKKLHESGQPIPGVSPIAFIQVSQKKENVDNEK